MAGRASHLVDLRIPVRHDVAGMSLPHRGRGTLAGHSGRGDRTHAGMAASRRGVAARETGDPGRVAGRERHAFRVFWFNKNCAEIALIFEQRTHRFLRSIRIA